MERQVFVSIVLASVLRALACPTTSVGAQPPLAVSEPNVRAFLAKGEVQELKPDGRTVVIKHEAIAGYMDAMTMPFKVKTPEELVGLQRGDEAVFRLQVSETESWIDQVRKTGKIAADGVRTASGGIAEEHPIPAKNPLLDYKFTNEVGQAVSLSDFRGQIGRASCRERVCSVV
jgi:protein SCO1/2